MKKQILAIFGILLISLVSAYNLTAGESLSIDLGEPYEYYSIEGNSTEIDLNISQSGNIVNISIGKYTKSDFFSLTFFNDKEEVIYKSSGDDSFCSPIKDFDWDCGEWGECINGTQIRTCKEFNNCGNDYGKPNIEKDCIVDVPINDTQIIGGCGTVTPGLEDECCQNLGFDRWDKENLRCVNNIPYLLLIFVILVLAILAIILYKKGRRRNEN